MPYGQQYKCLVARVLILECSEQLRQGLIRVREVIGENGDFTDKEIEDSLWHYYYDADKTVNYLLSTQLHAFILTTGS